MNNYSLQTLNFYSLECLTNDGEDPGIECANPESNYTWTYPTTGANYTGCANPHNDPKGNWCPTLLNNDNEFESTAGKWGYCSDNCPIDDGK